MERFLNFAEGVITLALALILVSVVGLTISWGWFDRSEPATAEPVPERVTVVEPKQIEPVVFEPVVEPVTLDVKVLEPEPEVVEPVEAAEPPYTERDLEILALIIYQEAGSDACSDKARQMVGEVVLNRVADPRFPDSIEEVALAKGQYGRLHWTGIQWPTRSTNPGEIHAVDRAYNVARELLDGTVDKLLPSDAVWQAEFVQGVEVVAQTDGFYFCR